MKTVCKINHSSQAPILRPKTDYDPALLVFDGKPKRNEWPSSGLEADGNLMSDDLFTFYNLAPGIIVYREELLRACEDFYWVSCEGTEPLPLICNGVRFEISHCVDFLPQLAITDTNTPPCPVDKHYSALFRIEERPNTDLYCASGIAGVLLNEFKGVYDHFGFKGLEFEEIWREG